MAGKLPKPEDLRQNLILAGLTDIELERLAPQLERYPLERRQVLIEINEPIAHVYFPVRGLASLIMGTMNGFTVEVAMVGNEGIIGLPVVLGSHTAPISCLVQVPGQAYRMSASAVRAEAHCNDVLLERLHLYAQTLFVQAAQSVVCMSHHSVVQRCARWLLMTRDRVSSDDFTLTQEFLAHMLGVRRASVSGAAAQLQAAGLIRYSRGHIVIVDRHQLERHACECYRIIQTEADRLLPK